MLSFSGLPVPALPTLGGPCLVTVCLPQWTVSPGRAKAVSVTVSQTLNGCSGNVITLGWSWGAVGMGTAQRGCPHGALLRAAVSDSSLTVWSPGKTSQASEPRGWNRHPKAGL